MKLPKLIAGRFLRRENRFRAAVLVNGVETSAHVPNSGRLTELFTPDRRIWLTPAGSPNRKTAYDLRLVEYQGALVSVDARLPNALFAEAVTAGLLSEYRYPVIQSEVSFGGSRLDFRLSGPEGVCWVEAKSVTLVVDGIARFPDAPTSRGRRHILDLIDAMGQGDRASVVFVVQRPDARSFRPHRLADPEFAEALSLASEAGVEIRAYKCQVSLDAISLANEIPVQLG